MRKLIFVLSFLFLVPGFTSAQGISSNELINNAKIYDGKTVTYTGEVIGEVMKRGDFAWVNLNDGMNAIGVWTPLDFTKKIIYTGSHKTKGDIIEVTGIFNRACPLHGGDLDIHAQTLRKIDSGKIAREKLDPGKIKQALILLGVLFSVWILTLFLRKQLQR